MKSFKNLGKAKALDVTTDPKDFIIECIALQEFQERFFYGTLRGAGKSPDFVPIILCHSNFITIL
jgi:hypothetical protein